jgi:hypothetical protein
MNNRIIDYDKVHLDTLTDTMVILQYKAERCSNPYKAAGMGFYVQHLQYMINQNEKFTDEFVQVSYNVSLSRHSKTLNNY